MFCGFPVIVATLPMFEAVATARRYGTGGRLICRVAASTNGTITRQMTSFTKNAERTPLVKTTVGRRCRGSRRVTTRWVIHAKNPARWSDATTTIIEKRRTIVPKSTDWSASWGPTTPSATMSTAPITAAPGRSIFIPGNLPRAKTT